MANTSREWWPSSSSSSKASLSDDEEKHKDIPVANQWSHSEGQQNVITVVDHSKFKTIKKTYIPPLRNTFSQSQKPKKQDPWMWIFLTKEKLKEEKIKQFSIDLDFADSLFSQKNYRQAKLCYSKLLNIARSYSLQEAPIIAKKMTEIRKLLTKPRKSVALNSTIKSERKNKPSTIDIWRDFAFFNSCFPSVVSFDHISQEVWEWITAPTFHEKLDKKINFLSVYANSLRELQDYELESFVKILYNRNSSYSLLLWYSWYKDFIAHLYLFAVRILAARWRVVSVFWITLKTNEIVSWPTQYKWRKTKTSGGYSEEDDLIDENDDPESSEENEKTSSDLIRCGWNIDLSSPDD